MMKQRSEWNNNNEFVIFCKIKKINYDGHKQLTDLRSGAS